MWHYIFKIKCEDKNSPTPFDRAWKFTNSKLHIFHRKMYKTTSWISLGIRNPHRGLLPWYPGRNRNQFTGKFTLKKWDICLQWPDDNHCSNYSGLGMFFNTVTSDCSSIPNSFIDLLFIPNWTLIAPNNKWCHSFIKISLK